MLRPISHQKNIGWVVICDIQLLSQINWLLSEVQRKNVEGRLNQTS